MATQTLAEAAKLINNEIVEGVAEDIITINPMFKSLPFIGFDGQGIVHNRENALGDVQMLAVGGTITAKAAATFTQQTFLPTKIIGDAEVDGLVQVTSQGGGVDQMAVEVSSKAKNVARQFQSQLATANGTSPNMNSLHSLCDASQYTTASAGQALSFELLDELLQLVTAKDGQVDFIVMPGRTLRAYRALVRGLGGAGNVDEVVELGDGTEMRLPVYNGVPIFRNDYLSVTETANGAATTGGALASVYAGCFDDGTRKTGLAAIYPNGSGAGIMVKPIGAAETKDQDIMRVAWYTNAALFNRKGLARLTSINN